MQRICVFSGSSMGVRPVYREAAEALGKELAKRLIGLVYGGASVGLMGVIADSVLAAGGEVIGVIPHAISKREIAHTHLTALHEVGSMHERKALMSDLADGFIALPGGFGTFDELFEVTTWAQLRMHTKPIGLLNVAHYFDPLLAMVQHAATEGFIQSRYMGLLLHREAPTELLDALTNYTPLHDQCNWPDRPPER